MRVEIPAEPETQFLLFVDWLHALLEDSVGVHGTGAAPSSGHTLSLADGSKVTVTPDGAATVVECDAANCERTELMRRVAEEARARALAHDLGNGVWWKGSMSGSFGITGITGMRFPLNVQMLRVMSEETLYRGRFRIGPAFLNFDPGEIPNETPRGLHTGTLHVGVTLRSPGPSHGHLSRRFADEEGGAVRVLTSFVTAIPMEGFGAFFPADEDEVKESLAATQEVAVKGVPVGSAVQGLARLKEREAADRVLGALHSYEAAISQRSASVALILFVTALEALCAPNAAWNRDKLTTRFVKFVQDLCPDAVGEILAHQNFRDAFGNYTSARRFLDQLYDMRSRPLHTGLVGRGFGDFLAQHKFAPQVQVALASELARAAVVEFLKAPRSSLVGHPMYARDDSSHGS